MKILILITTLLVTVFTNIASASTCSESMQSLINYEARHNNAITKYEHTVKQLEQGKTQERFIEHGEALNELHETAVTLKQATKKFGIDCKKMLETTGKTAGVQQQIKALDKKINQLEMMFKIADSI